MKDEASRVCCELSSLEELHGTLVFLRSGERLECPQIFSLTGFVFLLRVEPVFARGKFSNHRFSLSSCVSNQQVSFQELGVARVVLGASVSILLSVFLRANFVPPLYDLRMPVELELDR